MTSKRNKNKAIFIIKDKRQESRRNMVFEVLYRLSCNKDVLKTDAIHESEHFLAT